MPTLVVMAAGIGSRYGGLKQLDGVGPAGELLLEYSIFDAVEAGFTSVVFVIRPDTEADFRSRLVRRFESRIPCRLVHQTLDRCLGDFRPPPDRLKPWGTGHAVLVAAEAVSGPFGVINADDYYGRESFAALARHLESGTREYGLVGYVLRNTLSEHGSVARGVCRYDPEMRLVEVVERTRIEPEGTGARFTDESGAVTRLTGHELVSMNLWGFPEEFFGNLKDSFRSFLEEHAGEVKKEFFLPSVVNALVARGQATVRVLPSRDRWFGVTYRDDVPRVRAELQALQDSGHYPKRLWP
jgi:dTDP-glucose pyrophosphorylase